MLTTASLIYTKRLLQAACLTLTAGLAATASAQCVPGGGDHDCCTEGGPGCSDISCCETVCAIDPICCSAVWDNICVGEAEALCGPCGPTCGNSDHDCCTPGGPACNDADCCTAVCDGDPFCCDIEWDEVCAATAIAICGPCDNPNGDDDGDGLTNGVEAAGCTDPNNPDTDGDGLNDGAEVNGGTNPCNADSDNDGLSDGAETGCTSPINADSDGDGLNDGEEATYGTDPCDADTDNDGLSDGAEVTAAAGSGCPSPTNADSDGDSISDGTEVVTLPAGTNPCSADSDDDGLPDNVDPFPLNPGGTVCFIEDELRDLCQYIQSLPTSKFVGNNTIAKKLVRTVLAQTACAAANLVKCGKYDQARCLLETMLLFVDGSPNPNDFMVDSPEQDTVKFEVELQILLLEFF